MRKEMIHPMMVHFAIGLLVGGVGLGLLGWWFKSAGLRAAGIWAVWAGALAAGAAVLTGSVAEDAIPKDKALASLIDTHSTFAWITLIVFVVVALGWLIAFKGGRRRLEPWLHLLGVVGVALVVTTGYFGGEMVYNHGAAVQSGGTYVQAVQVKDAPKRPDSEMAPKE